MAKFCPFNIMYSYLFDYRQFVIQIMDNNKIFKISAQILIYVNYVKRARFAYVVTVSKFFELVTVTSIRLCYRCIVHSFD